MKDLITPGLIIFNADDPKTGNVRDDLRIEVRVATDPEPWSLTIEQMVEMTSKSRRWLFSHADDLPWIKRVTRKSLRGDEALLRKWIASRR